MTDITTAFRKLCPKCAAEGKTSIVRLFQINFEEAIPMCKNDECTYPQWTYPEGNITDWASLIVKRNFDDIPTVYSESLKNSSSSTFSCAGSSVQLPSWRSKSLDCLLSNSSKSVHTATWVSKVNPNYTSSSTPSSSRAQSPAISDVGEPVHRIVPVEPFLRTGQPHSFGTFDDRHNNIPNRNFRPEEKSVDFPYASADGSKEIAEELTTPVLVKKGKRRKPNSLGSDSLSSRSEESAVRPLTPDSFTQPISPPVDSFIQPTSPSEETVSNSVWPLISETSPPSVKEEEPVVATKKIKRLFVTADTFAKLTKSSQPLQLADIKKPELSKNARHKVSLNEPLKCTTDNTVVISQPSTLYSPTSPPEVQIVKPKQLSSLERSDQINRAALAGQFSVVIAPQSFK